MHTFHTAWRFYRLGKNVCSEFISYCLDRFIPQVWAIKTFLINTTVTNNQSATDQQLKGKSLEVQIISIINHNWDRTSIAISSPLPIVQLLPFTLPDSQLFPTHCFSSLRMNFIWKCKPKSKWSTCFFCFHLRRLRCSEAQKAKGCTCYWRTKKHQQWNVHTDLWKSSFIS